MNPRLLGALLGAGGGSLLLALLSRKKDKKLNALLGALAGGGIGYGAGPLFSPAGGVNEEKTPEYEIQAVVNKSDSQPKPKPQPNNQPKPQPQNPHQSLEQDIINNIEMGVAPGDMVEFLDNAARKQEITPEQHVAGLKAVRRSYDQNSIYQDFRNLAAAEEPDVADFMIRARQNPKAVWQAANEIIESFRSKSDVLNEDNHVPFFKFDNLEDFRAYEGARRAQQMIRNGYVLPDPHPIFQPDNPLLRHNWNRTEKGLVETQHLSPTVMGWIQGANDLDVGLMKEGLPIGAMLAPIVPEFLQPDIVRKANIPGIKFRLPFSSKAEDPYSDEDLVRYGSYTLPSGEVYTMSQDEYRRALNMHLRLAMDRATKANPNRMMLARFAGSMLDPTEGINFIPFGGKAGTPINFARRVNRGIKGTAAARAPRLAEAMGRILGNKYVRRSTAVPRYLAAGAVERGPWDIGMGAAGAAAQTYGTGFDPELYNPNYGPGLNREYRAVPTNTPYHQSGKAPSDYWTAKYESN